MICRRRTMNWVVKDYFTITFDDGMPHGVNIIIPAELTTTQLTYIQFSLDGGKSWSTVNNINNESLNTVTGSADKVMFRGKASTYGVNSAAGQYGVQFTSTSQFSVSGNIHSLITVDFDTLPETYFNNNRAPVFFGMFKECTQITDAKDLILPYKLTSNGCFEQMFSGCVNLKSAPALIAETLVMNCCKQMFYNCAKLKNIKCLATNISGRYCTSYWLYNVSTTGTFIKSATMHDWPSGFSGIPEGWSIVDATN